MQDNQFQLSAEEAFDYSTVDYEALCATFDRSLAPRGPAVLFDKLSDLLRPDALGTHVLDAGCAWGDHALDMARRFGCRVTGVDIVPYAVEQAARQIAESDVADKVHVEQGDIQSLRFDDETFDVVWCRDMLSLVPDLPGTLAEFARVLKPGGGTLAYNTFATDLMEPKEASRVYAPMGVVAANMSAPYFERTAAEAGFQVVERDAITTEWREHFEEDGDKLSTTQLLRIARMRRDRDRLIKEVGRKAYEVELADCHWGVYQMLGKLAPAIYTLSKTATS